MASKLFARLAWLALVCCVGQRGYSATLPTMPEFMTSEYTTELPPLENATQPSLGNATLPSVGNAPRTPLENTPIPPLETTTAATLHLRDMPVTTDTPVADPDPCPTGCDCMEREEGLVVMCAHRGLTTIPETVPNNAVYVNLKMNSIQTVTGTSFSKWPTKSIQKLNLSHNNLSVIDESAFKYFSRMWTINLGHNSLTNAVLSHLRLPALHEINVEYNPLELNATAGSGFMSYQSSAPDTLCRVVHRRTSVLHVVDSWRFLENVTQVLATVRCARPVVECVSQMPDVTTADFAGPNLSRQEIPHQVSGNAVSPGPAVACACPSDSDVDGGKLSQRLPSAKPTVYETVFYATLAVIFSSLMLFLVSQKYKHAWLRSGKPPARRSTRRHTTSLPHAANIVPLHPPLPHTHLTLTPQSRAPPKTTSP